MAFNAQHDGLIHDAKFDYYAKRLATCSGDGSINIFEVRESEPPTKLSSIQLHTSAVLAIAWAHPKFGSLLVSVGYDGKIFIVKEVASNTWQEVFSWESESPVVAVDWAPFEEGLTLAAGLANGNIQLISRGDDISWKTITIAGHQGGVNGISWAPYTTGMHGSISQFATCGGDNLVKVWALDKMTSQYTSEILQGHTEWVRDVKWSPSIGGTISILASWGEDRQVIIWKRHGMEKWTSQPLKEQFNCSVWKVSWSVAGNLLTVASSDNMVRVYKENTEGEWDIVSIVKSGGELESIES